MKENGIALPLWVAALLAAVLATGALPSGQAGSAGASEPEHKEAKAASEEHEEQRAGYRRTGWRNPVRLYREFFGLDPLPELDAKPAPATAGVADWRPSVGEVVLEAQARGYDLRSIVALVPDPIDSELPADFDQAIDAIQKGLAHAGYLPDRIWIPWTAGKAGQDDGDTKRLYRTSPGLLLFRRCREATLAAPAERELLSVFLIGETPKIGIQKEAFYQALDLAAALRPPAERQPFRILGPFFSGSAESLRLALVRWSATGGRQAPAAFDIVTGSATAGAGVLENVLAPVAAGAGNAAPPPPPSIRFFRAGVPEELQQEALSPFFEQMGWRVNKLALLVESDTAYGKSFDELPLPLVGNLPDGVTVIQIPSHVSAIRTAREVAGPSQTAGSTGVAPAAPKTQLTLNLTDHGNPVDLVPEFSPLSAPVNELAITNLLETIAREGFRYVGILATDPKDKLFLSDRIRRFAPDVVRFTFSGDLLFAHPQEQQAMTGVLVFSGFPLFTESGALLRAGDPTEETGRSSRRQFTSELQHGIFNAVRTLVEGYPQSLQTTDRAAVWVSAVGNGALWPISSVSVEVPSSMNLLAPPPASKSDAKDFAAKAGLQLLFYAAILCGLGWWLRRTATFPEPSCGDGGRSRRWLLKLGLAVLALGSAVLLLLDSLPDWWWWPHLPGHSWSSAGQPPTPSHATRAHVFYLLGLGLAYLYLLLNLVGPSDPEAESGARLAKRPWSALVPRTPASVLGLAAGVLVPFLLACGLSFWVPAEIESFYLRTRSFGSGLSLAVPLSWLGLALYLWILCELKRRRLTAWQAIDWPADTLCEPAFEGGDGVVGVVGSLRSLVERTIPQARGFWIAVLVILGTPFLFLWWSFRPLTETHAFSHVLLPLLLLAFLLSVVSFYRFFRIWQTVQKILVRIEYTPLAGRLRSLSGEVGWEPMKSFAWQIPPFKSLTLSVARLQAVAKQSSHRSQLATAGLDPERLGPLLRQIFAADASDDLAAEIENRRELGEIFQGACRALQADRAQDGVADFFAVRVIVYLRYIFAHLRNCLLGAMCAGLFLIFATTSYNFVPKSFVSILLWAALGTGVAMTFWSFVEMDRNVALSLIGGSEPGKVSFNRTFVSNLFTYALIPLLGLLATQVPSAGQLLGILKPLLRVLGAG